MQMISEAHHQRRYYRSHRFTVMFSLLLLLGVLYTLAPTVWGDVSQRATLGNKLASNGTGTPSYSMNVTDCPGGNTVETLWSCH